VRIKGRTRIGGEVEREMFGEIVDDRKNLEKSIHGSSV